MGKRRGRYRHEGVGGIWKFESAGNGYPLTYYFQCTMLSTGVVSPEEPSYTIIERATNPSFPTINFAPSVAPRKETAGSYPYLDYLAWSYDDIDLLKMEFEDVLNSMPSGSVDLDNKQPLLESYNSKEMFDVVGSGWQFNRKGQYTIINPCSSTKKRLQSDIRSFGSRTVDVSVYLGGSRNSDDTFSTTVYYQVTLYEPPTIGLPPGMVADILSRCPQYPIELADSALADAFLKVEQGAFDALTFVGELDETLKYVVTRLKTLGRLLRNIKRGNFRAIRKDLAGVDPRDAWLEARYAIRPLILDIEQGYEALTTGNEIIPFNRFKAGSTDLEDFVIDEYQYIGNLEYHLQIQALTTVRKTAGAYARAVGGSPLQYKWGLYNLVSSSWELIPFSFILDWFVNMAGLLAALNPNPTYRVEGAFQAVRTRTNLAGTVTISDGYTQDTLPISGSVEHYRREPRKSPPLLTFDLNLSIPKVIDLLSIVTR